MSQLESKEGDKRFFSGEWLRKATENEIVTGAMCDNGVFLIWYQMDLKSAKPLQEEHVRRTAAHMYRKVASLSVCYGKRGGETWMRRATNPNVDVEVLTGLQLEEVRESLRNKRYNSETGPLFCVRLVLDSPDDTEDTGDLEPSFPYKSRIFIGLHHGITDGTSNHNILGFCATLLNDVLANKPINDDEPIGHFASDEETMKLINEQKLLVQGNAELKANIERDFLFQNSHKPLIANGFPPSNKAQHTTTIAKVIDQTTTSKFIQRCKQEKVTVNSVFTAIMNTAIVDTLIEYGNIKESYVIENIHTLNLRRYWEPRPSVPFGLHMDYPIMMFSDTPKNIHEKFWDYARALGEGLKDYVLSKRLLADKAYLQLYPNAVTRPDDFLACDYITSNMGDVTRIVTEGGEHVRVTNTFRGATVQNCPYPVLLSGHTFRGRFHFIFDYNEALIKQEVAEKVCSHTVKHIQEISR